MIHFYCFLIKYKLLQKWFYYILIYLLVTVRAAPSFKLKPPLVFPGWWCSVALVFPIDGTAGAFFKTLWWLM